MGAGHPESNEVRFLRQAVRLRAQRFKTLILYAGVAQLVEQLICNQQVGGSSPSTSSTLRGHRPRKIFNLSNGRVPEWPKGADCKSVAF